jgi:hypothetical protein
MSRWTRAALLAALLPAPALAHPGSGIVVDRVGQVYFVDTGSGLWKIDTKGALVKIDAPRFHWLTLDADDRFKNAQLPSGASGEVTRVGSAPTLILASDFPLAVGRDGNLYYPRRSSGGSVDIVRLLPSGQTSTLTSLPFPYLNGLTAAPDGFLYFAEHKNIRKISAQGQVTMVAANIAPSGCASIPGTEGSDMLRGLTVDAGGTVYVAASACGSVLKVAPDGKITKLLQTESPWSPTAVALSGKGLYVQEYLHTATEDRRAWVPRVRKLFADGKSAVVATVSR